MNSFIFTCNNEQQVKKNNITHHLVIDEIYIETADAVEDQSDYYSQSSCLSLVEQEYFFDLNADH